MKYGLLVAPFVTAWKYICAWFRFAVYFTVIILGIGGLGVWISFFQLRLQVTGVTSTVVLGNLATFVIALTVTAFADYLVTKSEGDERTKDLILFSLTMLAAASGVCIFIVGVPRVQEICAWTGGLLAVLVWVVVNAHNRNLVEEKPVGILGGEVK